MEFVDELQGLLASVDGMVEEAKHVYEESVKIRRHSEEIESLVNECLALLEK